MTFFLGGANSGAWDGDLKLLKYVQQAGFGLRAVEGLGCRSSGFGCSEVYGPGIVSGFGDPNMLQFRI